MIYYDHAVSNLQRRAASGDPATGQRPPGPSRDTPGRYRAGDRQPGGDDRSSVRPRPPPADARPDGRRSFQLSMKAPAGIGSQKLTSRQPRTPSVATPRVTPKLTSSSGATESMTPRPAGVTGSAPATLAIP